MSPVRLVRALLAGAVAVVVGAFGLGAAPASAASRDLGGIMWSDTQGTSQSLLSVYTAKGCAAEADRVSAVVYGKGFPAEGQVVVAPSTLLLSATRPMQLPLSNAFVVYAERNSTALEGKYEIKVLCTDRFNVTTFGEFTTTITWDTPGNSLKNVEKATFVAKNTAKVDPAQAELPQSDEVVPVPRQPGSAAPQLPTAPTSPGATGSGAAGGAGAADGTAGSAAGGDAGRAATPTPNAGAGQTPGSTPSAGAVAGDAATTGTAAADDTGTTVAILLVFVLVLAGLGFSAWWLLGRREGTV